MKNRKDPNYIASVEKAIADKYGKDTVQDFRTEWEEGKEKEYLNQLRSMRIKNDKNISSKQEIIVGDIKILKRHSRKKDDRTCPGL